MARGLEGKREASQSRGSAKVQIGAVLLCKGAKVGGRDTSSGLRSRQSGIRYGLSGAGTGAGLNLDLVLNTRTWDLRMDHLLRMRCHRIPTRCSRGFSGLKLDGEDYD